MPNWNGKYLKHDKFIQGICVALSVVYSNQGMDDVIFKDIVETVGGIKHIEECYIDDMDIEIIKKFYPNFRVKGKDTEIMIYD